MDAHSIAVTHIPLDAPGIRVVGNIPGVDVSLGELAELVASIDADLDKTKAALRNPATRDLAEAVRAALLGNRTIAYHLLQVHDGIANGNLNYDETPMEARHRNGI
jgi:hypothetical protein